MADKKEIVTILKKYSAAYPTSSLGKEGVELYVKSLEKFQARDIANAMDILITKCKFFPTIAEIYDQLTPDGQVREVLEPPQEELAIMQALYDEADREFDEKVARLRELGKAKGE